MNNMFTLNTTWASSQYLTEDFNLPIKPLFNNSIRQIIPSSIAAEKGEKIRLKLSNKCGKEALLIKGATIAISASQASGKIKKETLTKIPFNKKDSVLIPQESEVYSDFFEFSFPPLAELSITLYYGERQSNGDDIKLTITGHPGSRTNSFFEEGNALEKEEFSHDSKVAHWYTIAAIEVESKIKRNLLVCFGDSITDGRGSTDDLQDRWTNHLARLGEGKFALVNQGIGGTCVSYHGVNRFESDVLNQEGLTHIIMLYGINDIIYLNSTAEAVIKVYKDLINKARNKNIKFYGSTILPFGNFSEYKEEKEKIRQEVNTWIRNTPKEDGGFDTYFDFDKLMKDKDNEKILAAPFDCSDGLHPSAEGYKQMATAFNDLSLFL